MAESDWTIYTAATHNAIDPALISQGVSNFADRPPHSGTNDFLYGFHALRHTAVTNVYRATRDLFLAQRFARHASPLTTTVYTHPSDQELFEGEFRRCLMELDM